MICPYKLLFCAFVMMTPAGCRIVPRAPHVTPPSAVMMATHFPPDEAVFQNAGALRCLVSSPVDLAAVSPDGTFVVGFGERGGLVAWSSAKGVRARPLNQDGAFVGPEVALNVQADAKPVEIAPLGRGFVVLAKRVEMQKTLCESRCIDATCAGWPAGVAQPQVCSSSCSKPCIRPIHANFYVQYVDFAGKPIGSQTSFATGLVDIEAMLLGDGRSLGIMTGTEIVWVHTDDRENVVLNRRPLPSMQYALPIRGRGMPSLLALGEDGSARRIDAEGEHALRGSILDSRAGRLLDARLQARWDEFGRLHIAKQAWLVSLDSIQYSVVDGTDVRPMGEIERGRIRPPFAEYVEPHWEEGRFRRRSWMQHTIGEDIDLRHYDARADVPLARFAWSGKFFLFVVPTPEPDSTRLRLVNVTCNDGVGG